MKNILISYATPNYQKFQLKLRFNAVLLKCFDEIIDYRENEFKQTEFYKSHTDILDLKKGAGCWLWKPYLIMETLKNADEGDIVLYLDCQHVIKTNTIIDFVKSNMDRDVFLPIIVDYRGLNKRYTKRDCFVLMDCDKEIFWNGYQVEAGQIAFRVSDMSKKLVSEWLTYGINKNIMTDLPNVCGQDNFVEFMHHRSDQSILTNLAIKYDYKRVPLLTVLNYIDEERILSF